MVNNITYSELYSAYSAYRKITRAPRNKNTSRQFFAFLGVDERDDIWSRTYAGASVPDDVAQKIKWMTSPNAEALFKAWKIKHEKNTI